MASLSRRIWVLMAVLATAATVVSAGSGAAGSTAAASTSASSFKSTTPAKTTTALKPTLYFLYAMDCTFTVVDDNGKPVTSIAPGAYQVDVRTPVIFGAYPLSSYGLTDMTACKGFPQFQLTGPGVTLATTMTAGCQDDLTFPETFQASSTYTAVDNNQPTVARATFSTTANGVPQVPTTTLGATTSRSETSTNLIGSKSVLGTLKATLSASGVSTLTNSKGKAISKLKAGRYTIVVRDQDPTSSFSLLAPKAKTTTTLTTASFVGRRNVMVTLKVGKWMYLSSGMRQFHAFTVA